MNKIVIGISGKKRSGKDTTARALKKILPNAIICYFADTLKQITALALGLPLDHFYDDFNKEYLYEIAPNVKISGRELLQKIGTEMFRNNLHTDFWVYTLMRKIKELPDEIQYVIIPDVRFPNEYEAIINNGGYVIRVIRPGHESLDNHPSEIALDNHSFHAQIYNSEGFMGENFLKDIRYFLEAFKLIKNEESNNISE